MVDYVVEQVYLQHEQKGKKPKIVIAANTISNPGTVVVVDTDAETAGSAVPRSLRSNYLRRPQHTLHRKQMRLASPRRNTLIAPSSPRWERRPGSLIPRNTKKNARNMPMTKLAITEIS